GAPRRRAPGARVRFVCLCLFCRFLSVRGLDKTDKRPAYRLCRLCWPTLHYEQTKGQTQMTKLTQSARIILRSRLRRHKDQLVLAQHLEGQYGTGKISDLRNAQLIECARMFGLDVPAPAECAAYDNAKANGASADRAIAAADN